MAQCPKSFRRRPFTWPFWIDSSRRVTRSKSLKNSLNGGVGLQDLKAAAGSVGPEAHQS